MNNPHSSADHGIGDGHDSDRHRDLDRHEEGHALPGHDDHGHGGPDHGIGDGHDSDRHRDLDRHEGGHALPGHDDHGHGGHDHGIGHGHDGHGYAGEDISIAMVYPDFLYAGASAVAVALVASVLGCLLIWRRMAYFGDSLAHNAMIGIVIGIVLGIGIRAGMIISACIFALLLVLIQKKRRLTGDAALAVLAYGGFAVGILILTIMDKPQVDIHTILFGDVFAITRGESFITILISACVMAFVVWRWSDLILMIMDDDLARAEGLNTGRLAFLLNLITALMLVLTVPTAGILMVVAMMVIPASTARQWARTPESMVVLAAVLAVMQAIVGCVICAVFALPSGPVIVTLSTLSFAVLFPLSLALGKKE